MNEKLDLIYCEELWYGTKCALCHRLIHEGEGAYILVERVICEDCALEMTAETAGGK